MTALVAVDRWEVRNMVLTPEKLRGLWVKFQGYKTLFSDMTRNDPANFIRALIAPNILWYEVWEGEQIVGMIWIADLEQVIDATVHMAFFDRQPAEKVGVCKEFAKYLFATLPVQRLTITPPEIYHATIRLAEKLGFRREGCKRQAVLLGGKYVNQLIFGLTRDDMEAM
jgi:hypothetical protein